MDVTFLLSQSEFFKDVSAPAKEALAAICRPQWLEKGQTLFSEGDKGHSVFLLAAGNIQLSKSGPEGKEVVIKMLRPGEMFAEIVLFESDRYPVNAAAIRKSLVYRMPTALFHGLLEDSGFRREFIGMIMKKLRYLTEQFYSAKTDDVETRFFNFLEKQYGRRNEYKLTLKKKDIASAIGTIPETFSRLLRRLKKEEKADWQGRVLKISAKAWE